MRTAGNRYMGLGAGLGVPQSALEAVTSLDPNDYLYPQPSAAQQKAALQQLSSLGSIWMNKGSGGNAFGGNPAYKSTGPYSNIADINIQDFYDARSTVSLDTRDETTDYGIFNLDLDIDCSKMLAGKEPSSDSGEANSDHSTFTDEAKVIVGQTLAQTAHSPRSPSATSPNHATTIAINGADEDDGELLLSHAPSFNLEESEIIAAGIYPFLIPPASADGRSSNKGNMISSAIKRSKPSIGGVGFGAHRGAPLRRCSSQLKLTLNYGAAVEMINTALDVHGDRKVPGHIGTPSIGEFNDIQAGDMIASTPLEGSLKRRRDPEV